MKELCYTERATHRRRQRRSAPTPTNAPQTTSCKRACGKNSRGSEKLTAIMGQSSERDDWCSLSRGGGHAIEDEHLDLLEHRVLHRRLAVRHQRQHRACEEMNHATRDAEQMHAEFAGALNGEARAAARRGNLARTPPHNRRTQPGTEPHNNSQDRVAFVPLVCARWPLSGLRAATGLSGQLPIADAAFSKRWHDRCRNRPTALSGAGER